jgi:uncharacterized protein
VSISLHAATAPANKGGFASEDDALKAVVARLVDALDPAAIWLFGSRARGTARPDSDFDLLIVAKPDGTFGSESFMETYEPLRGMGVGVDVVPCSAQDFHEAAAFQTTLVAQVIKEGKVLYEARQN